VADEPQVPTWSIEPPRDPQAEGFVDACLDLVGPLAVSQETRDALLHYARMRGSLHFRTASEARTSAQRVSDLLQLIVASREYQLN